MHGQDKQGWGEGAGLEGPVLPAPPPPHSQPMLKVPWVARTSRALVSCGLEGCVHRATIYTTPSSVEDRKGPLAGCHSHSSSPFLGCTW